MATNKNTIVTDKSSNVQDKDNATKKTKRVGNYKGQVSKKNKYPEERQKVLDDLFAILGVSEDNMIFNLNELDSDEDKQQEIINLVDDIKQYFNYGNWTYFSKPPIGKPYLVLARCLLKEMGYKMECMYTVSSKTKKISEKKMEIVKI